MLYKLLLFIHIFSSILSIGPFFVLLAVTKMLPNVKEEGEQDYLHLFKFSVRLVKHAGHVLVVSGILLMVIAKWHWSTSWIAMTWFVMFGSIFFLARAFTPTLRKFNESGHSRDQLIAKLNRSTWMYIALLTIMLWLMVAKPNFW